MSEIASRVLAGHVASGARVIRWLEDGERAGIEALKVLYPKSGRAHIVGITGPPGAGKSTLVDALIAEHRARGRRVAVVAVDPSSPFSGGAILGDRVRMQRHATDPDVFIRSMATRGQLGGLSRTTFEAAAVLDAMGYDVVMVETVGVGQDELEVVDLAHTTLVV
ncbi:MAG: ATP/GTP-binding protein, partial [Deltaproteobacteria bacterium]|nr:ATP/GTP-binding protein [Deltaproteobacteria bacterium]